MYRRCFRLCTGGASPFMANEGKGLAFVVAMIAAMGCAFVVTMVANMVERRKKEALLLNKQQ
ncbi:putative uncharacterized protein [Clostridium sp. CAG:43]|nr:putative uncharacterized protein [Clostridium sp. CAG:43]